jgi:hypothetical protein
MLLVMLLQAGVCLKFDGQSRSTVSDIEERRAEVRPILDLALASGAFRPKDKIPGWHFWWVNETGAMGDYVEIFVAMDGRANRSPSM